MDIATVRELGWQDRKVHLPMEQVLSGAALAVDCVVIILVSILSGVGFHVVTRDQIGDIPVFAATGVIAAALLCGTVRILGAHYRRRDSSDFSRVRTAVMIWSLIFLFLILLAFSLKISAQFSRGTIFTFYLGGMAAVATSRWVTPRLLAHWSYTNAYRGSEILVIAPPGDPAAAALRALLGAQGCSQFRNIEFHYDGDPVCWVSERKRLVAAVFEAAHGAAHGDIYFFGGRMPPAVQENFLQTLRIIPRAVYLVPDTQLSGLLRREVKAMGDAMAVEFQRSPLSRAEKAIKRGFDILAAGAGLMLFAPLFLLIAIAITLDSKGPVFFRQTRHGYRGRPFKIVKFRSMRVMEDGANVPQATRNDARITRVGGFLRKTSLDELPQLWNVLAGEMSVIGPRPHAVAHDRYFSQMIENYEVRQHVKPGITGWAQVNGLRGETPNIDLMYRRIELDIWYATNCSILLDVNILLRTCVEVLRQRNAY